MQRYFLESDYQSNQSLVITGEDYHHIVNVMRMPVGEVVYLSFHQQVTVTAEIIDITSSEVFLKEQKKEEQLKELPHQVAIACGYPKGDKLELVAQKGTELGMHQLLAFPSQTSVVKWDEKKRLKKEARLLKICKEAAEQSHRQQLPSVSLFPSFETFLKTTSKYDVVLVAYEESAKEGEQATFAQMIRSLPKESRVLVIFGPEGGISPKEIEQFEQIGAKKCGLGPRILRAETAPLYCLAAMSYQWELLG